MAIVPVMGKAGDMVMTIWTEVVANRVYTSRWFIDARVTDRGTD